MRPNSARFGAGPIEHVSFPTPEAPGAVAAEAEILDLIGRSGIRLVKPVPGGKEGEAKTWLRERRPKHAGSWSRNTKAPSPTGETST